MAWLQRWSPYRRMVPRRQEWENGWNEWPLAQGSPWGEAGVNEPCLDVGESENDYQVKLEMPGVDKQDIKVDVNGDVITVQGEKRQREEEKDKNVYRQEIDYGSFSRTFSLPGPIEGDKVEAEYRDGILRLTVPKAESAKKRQVQVK